MIQKSLHIVLVLGVVISSMGMVVNRHYCRAELKSISVFGEAKSCHEGIAEAPACPFHPPVSSEPGHSQEDKNCCKNETELLKLDNDFLTSSQEAPLWSPKLLLSLFVRNLQIIWSEPEIYPVYYLNYKPPLLVCDVHLSLQTFLC